MGQEHIEKLREARRILVNARRNQDETIATPGAKTGEESGPFIKIQQAIEAIDCAIKDEEKLERTKGE